MKNIFDSENYKTLKSKYVGIDKKFFGHQYFNNHCDIALGLSTDGCSGNASALQLRKN